MNVRENELENFSGILSFKDLPKNNKYLLYDTHLGKYFSGENYLKILEVVRVIISNSLLSKWPDDNMWRECFSLEFNKHFPDLSREECDVMLKTTEQKKWHELPWDFGCWLDVLKRRTWCWVGHERKGKFLHIALSVPDYHASDLEAFEEIIKACGVKIIRREVLKR